MHACIHISYIGPTYTHLCVNPFKMNTYILKQIYMGII